MKRIVALFFIMCCFGLGSWAGAMEDSSTEKLKSLINAVQQGNDINVDLVQGLDVDSYIYITKFKEEVNALSVAAFMGKLDLAKQLIENYGANINAQNNNGLTALMFSIEGALALPVQTILEERKKELNNAIFEVFQYLLTKNPNLSLTTINNKNNIIHCAISLPERNKTYLEELLNYVNIDLLQTKNSMGKTPSMLARQANKYEFARLIQSKILELENEPQENDEERLEKLVKAAWDGKDISTLGYNNFVYNNINKYRDFEDFKDGNINALSAAAIQGHLAGIKQIVETYKADINSQNNDQHTVLMLIIIQEFMTSQINKTLKTNNKLLEVFTYLLKQKPDLSLTDKDGWNVLHFAATLPVNKKDYLKELLKYATLELLTAKNNRGETPLKAAQIAKNKPIIDIIQAKIKALTEPSEQPLSDGEELIENLIILKNNLSSLTIELH